MKTVFKKGMTVYWGELKGEVVNENNWPNVTFNIVVLFETKTTQLSFTSDGRHAESMPPVLSLTPYTLNGFSQEPKIEKDTLVYVKDFENSQWEMRFYSHFENGIHFCFYNQSKSKETIDFTSWEFVETKNPLLK